MRAEPTRPTVLLDLDGTIIDPKAGILGGYRHALTALGAPVPEDEELTWVIGPALRSAFPRILGPDCDVERCVALYREYFGSRGMYECQVYDGMRAAIVALRAQCNGLFVCTAKPLHFAAPIVDHIGLGTQFDRVFGPDLGGKLDDKGDLIAHMMTETGFDPARAVMVGDRQSDIEAARRHGIAAIGVLWGFGSRAELERARPDALCTAPEELAEAVTRLIGAGGDAT